MWSAPWRDRVDVLVGERSAAACWRRGPWSFARGQDATPSGRRVDDSAQAFDEVCAWLEGHVPAGAETRVIVADELVRYAWARGAAALRAPAQRDAAARGCLETAYGDAVGGWSSVLGMVGTRNGDALACGIDAARLATMLGTLARAGLRVRSAVPRLAHAYEQARVQGLLAGAAWFVVLDPGRASVAAIDDGGWRAVRSQRLHAVEALPGLIEQVRLSADLGDMAGDVVVAARLAGAPALAADAAGRAWRAVALDRLLPMVEVAA